MKITILPARLRRTERRHLEVFQFHFQPNEGHKGYEGRQSLLIVSFQFGSRQCPKCVAVSTVEWLWALPSTYYYLVPNPAMHSKINKKLGKVKKKFQSSFIHQGVSKKESIYSHGILRVTFDSN